MSQKHGGGRFNFDIVDRIVNPQHHMHAGGNGVRNSEPAGESGFTNGVRNSEPAGESGFTNGVRDSEPAGESGFTNGVRNSEPR